MASLAQLNLSESRFVPAQLSGFAMITLWLAEKDGELKYPDGRPNGDGWELRAYASVDDLVAVEGRVLHWIHPRQLDWDVVEDYPDWDDLENLHPSEHLSQMFDTDEAREALGNAAVGTKLGGWLSLIQSEIYWAPENRHPASPTYCLQVDSDEKVGLNLWDSGVLHIGLGELDGNLTWVAETQFM